VSRDLNDLHRAGELEDMDAPENVPEAAPAAASEAAPRWIAQTSAKIVGPALERMLARWEGRERPIPIATELGGSLSSLTMLRPGTHVLVGGTGSGKNQLALQLALHAAREGHSVTYIGLELDAVALTARLLALLAPPGQWSDLEWPEPGKLHSGEALKRARDAAATLEALPLSCIFADTKGERGLNADDVGEIMRQAAESAAPDRPALVVLDFLQLLSASPAVYEDRDLRQRISRASYRINDATRDGRVVALLVSSTARGEGRYDDLDLLAPRPGSPDEHVGWGKESGEIEYAATSVLVLRKVKQQPGHRAVALAKNRHGYTGWAGLEWNGTAFQGNGGTWQEMRAVARADEAAKAAEAARTLGGRGRGGQRPKPKPMQEP